MQFSFQFIGNNIIQISRLFAKKVSLTEKCLISSFGKRKAIIKRNNLLSLGSKCQKKNINERKTKIQLVINML